MLDSSNNAVTSHPCVHTIDVGDLSLKQAFCANSGPYKIRVWSAAYFKDTGDFNISVAVDCLSRLQESLTYPRVFDKVHNGIMSSLSSTPASTENSPITSSYPEQCEFVSYTLIPASNLVTIDPTTGQLFYKSNVGYESPLNIEATFRNKNAT